MISSLILSRSGVCGFALEPILRFIISVTPASTADCGTRLPWTRTRAFALPVPIGVAGAVVVHDDATALGVNMDIWRGDVSPERRVLEREDPRNVDPPRPSEAIGVREADEFALVMGEVEVVAAERMLDPFRDADERRAVEVVADAGIMEGTEDGIGGEAGDGEHGERPEGRGER